MAWKWFVQTSDVIDGPLTTEDVQSRLQNGQLAKNSLVWGPGTESWQNPQMWLQNLSGMNQDGAPDMQNEAWHYAAGGQSRGPMSRQNLIDQLKELEGAGEIMVWTKGMKEWAPLYEFHDLLNEIGINKRLFPRADLTGKAVLKINGNVLIAPLLSISEGGFGIGMDTGMTAGEMLTAEIQSPMFREALQVKAEVRYVGQGVIGLKFNQLSVETKGVIIQFIKQNQVRFPIKAA